MSPDIQPRVSIIMLTYSRPQYIGRAINSVIAQDFEQWELLVVHDGPNDQIAAVMEEWQKRDGRIRYLHRAKGGNIANATNFGLKQARGEYVAILDDDDYWREESKLSKQVGFLESNPEYAGCGAGLIAIDEDGNEVGRFYKALEDRNIRRVALVANPMAHSAGMFRRGLIEACGLYDETLDGFQDWDVWLKLGQLGKLRNFPEHWLVYQIWSGGGSFHQQRANTRSALRIVLRHRRNYPGFVTAFGVTLASHVYSHFPMRMRRWSFQFLSRMKKAAFAPK